MENSFQRLSDLPPIYWRLLAYGLFTALSVVVLLEASVVLDGKTYFWLDDDQMVSMRYGRNLAEGKGLVWNEGERIEGYTNFLWTLVMAAVHLLPVGDHNASLVVKVINWGLVGVLLILAERLLRLFRPEPGLALVHVNQQVGPPVTARHVFEREQCLLEILRPSSRC